MNYYLNEGTLALPFAYTDSSMTILKFPEQKSSLTIVRGEMPPALSLNDTVEMQRNLFKREFKTVVLGETRAAKLGHSPAMDAMEFYCMFDKSNVKQYQMNLLIKQGKYFITFSYTQMRAFTKEDLACWDSIKTDFVFSAQWHQAVTEGVYE